MKLRWPRSLHGHYFALAKSKVDPTSRERIGLEIFENNFNTIFIKITFIFYKLYL